MLSNIILVVESIPGSRPNSSVDWDSLWISLSQRQELSPLDGATAETNMHIHAFSDVLDYLSNELNSGHEPSGPYHPILKLELQCLWPSNEFTHP